MTKMTATYSNHPVFRSAEAFGNACESVGFFVLHGDAMLPEFPSGTVFAVDYQIRHYVKDGLYLLNYPGMDGQQVKRVIRPGVDKHVLKVTQSNKLYEDFAVTTTTLDVAGLVVGSFIYKEH